MLAALTYLLAVRNTRPVGMTVECTRMSSLCSSAQSVLPTGILKNPVFQSLFFMLMPDLTAVIFRQISQYYPCLFLTALFCPHRGKLPYLLLNLRSACSLPITVCLCCPPSWIYCPSPSTSSNLCQCPGRTFFGKSNPPDPPSLHAQGWFTIGDNKVSASSFSSFGACFFLQGA